MMSAALSSSALDLLLARYRRHMQALHYSPQTIYTRAACLRLLTNFLSEINLTEPQMITPQVIADFQRWLFLQPTCKGTARFAATSNRVLSAARSFLRFLKTEGVIGRDPTEALEYAREPDRLPRNILTPREAKRIIEAADPSTTLGYRDRTILEVFYATGIRKGELIGLNLEDVKLEDGLLHVRAGKGNKDRVVPLGRWAVKCLESYIAGIRPDLLKGKPCRSLFVSLVGRTMSGMAVHHLVKKHARLSGVKKHVTCHLWRHTCATHLVQNRANLRHVQEILGHQNLSATERYLSLTIQDLKAAHHKYHPREKEASRAERAER